MTQVPYAKIPQSVLCNKCLSLEARLVLGWLIGRPSGWILNIGHMTNELGITEQKWRRIRNELISGGFFNQQKKKTKNGTYQWKHTWTTKPTLQNPSSGESNDGKATGCEAEHGNVQDLKQRSKNKEKGGVFPVKRTTALAGAFQHKDSYSYARSDLKNGYQGINRFLKVIDTERGSK